MPHPAAAMLRSPSSLLRLSRRLQRHLLRPGNSRLPSPPLSARPRFLSSSSSSSSPSPPDGVGWTSYDPLTDTLGPVAAVPSASASASDSESPAESQAWGVFDPVAGRIVMQDAPPPASSPSTSDDEDGKEAKAGAEEKGKVTRSGGRALGRWSAVAVPRKAVGKARKLRGSFVCSNCKQGYTQWWGICPNQECKAVGTLDEYDPEADAGSTEGSHSHHAIRSWIPQKSKEMVPQSLEDVNKGFDQAEWRIPLTGRFGMEISRVLGGGIVPGSLILVGGDPGVGKSSLMLQVASNVLEGFKDEESSPVIYVSGEESIEQIGLRASRMNITSKNLFLYSGTDIEDILDKIQPLSPRALIIDSIQTVYLTSFAGSAGNLTQVKECTSALLRFAKLTSIPVFLIGHVNKTGDIAGPRLLEHIVDVVLYMEGERCSSHRLLRSVKNRFGSTDELGVFEMSEFGLQAVLNPSEMFLTEHDSDSEVLAGLAVAVILDGSRAFAVEVQALCVSGSFGIGQAVGIPSKRADVLISVLMKQASLKLQNTTIFINVVSGFQLTETAGDLAIAASICSSFLEFPIPNDVAFIGEVGLGGELRTFILLGAVPFRRDVPRLHKLGVHGVITLNEPFETLVPASMYQSHGIDHLVIPTRDYMFAPSLVDINQAVDFIHRNASCGRITYIHCKAGRGRSTTVVLCYLVKYKNMTPAAAFEHVRSKRAQVLLTHSQWKVVQEFSKRNAEFPAITGESVTEADLDGNNVPEVITVDESLSCRKATPSWRPKIKMLSCLFPSQI